MTDNEAESKLGIKVFSGATTKSCKKCHKVKLLREFARNRGCKKDGHVDICKECINHRRDQVKLIGYPHNINSSFTKLLSARWV